MNKKSYIFFLFVLCLSLPELMVSATYYSRINGNWNTSTTWSLISCSGVASGAIPGAADNVIICAGRTVTMNGSPASCLSLTVNGTANWTTAVITNIGIGGLTVNNGGSLTGAAVGVVNVTGALTIPAGAATTIGGITIAVTGATNISGTLTFNNLSGNKTFSNIFINSGGSISSSVAETYAISGNLSITAGTITGSNTGIFNVAGAFSVGAGTSAFNAGQLNVSGTTTISGTLNWGSTAGSKDIRNLVISAGGSWNNAADESFTISGNIQHDGAFTSGGTGLYTLTGSGRTISGTSLLSFARLTISGSYTNLGTLMVVRGLSGTGSLTQGSTGVFNIFVMDGQFTLTTFNASTPGNTVNYCRTTGGMSGGNQDIRTPSDGNYAALIISGNGTKRLQAATICNGNVLISSATLSTNNFSMNVSGNFTNNSAFDAGTSLVTLNGTAAQTIGGTTATAFDNLTISNPNALVSATTNFSVASILNISAGSVLSPAAGVIISGTGTLAGNGTAKVTKITGTPDFITQYTITAKILSGLNIDYAGAGNQTVNVFNYGSLTISTNGVRTVTFPAAMVGVAAVFSPTAVTTTYVIPGNTIDFNGAIAQAVPSFTYNNLICSGSGAKTLGGNIVVQNDLTISSNLDVSVSNYAVSIQRNWVNNGTFTAQSGTVTFNGSAAQTLSGSAITTFNALDINNSSGGVSLTGGSYILNSVINPINGNFNANGQSFTMISDASRTARIGQKGATASLSGNFIIQRFISSRDTSYADLAATVQGTTIMDWDNELPAVSYTYNPPVDLPSAYTYDESADVYVPITVSSAALSPGQGYEIFLAGDYFYANLPNTTMDAVGVPNQGDFDLSGLISNNAQGWNLVGNPFASSVSWASIYAASGGAASGLYDFIEMYDYTIGDWNGYTSADGIEIGSAQGFWVYGLPAASPLTLIVPESSKTSSSNSSIKASVKVQPYFTLKISTDNTSSANFSHVFKMAVKADAKEGFDFNDIPFRSSPNKATPQLYSIIEDRKMNINVFNSSADKHAIQLKTKAGYSGKYSIEAAGFDFVADYSCVLLKDKLQNKMIDLKSQNKYEFIMNVSEDSDRFVLYLSKDKDCRLLSSSAINMQFADNISILHSPEADLINFSFNENTNVIIQVSNILGQNLFEKEITVSSGAEKVILPSEFNGAYLIRVISDKGTVTKKFVR